MSAWAAGMPEPEVCSVQIQRVVAEFGPGVQLYGSVITDACARHLARKVGDPVGVETLDGWVAALSEWRAASDNTPQESGPFQCKDTMMEVQRLGDTPKGNSLLLRMQGSGGQTVCKWGGGFRSLVEFCGSPSQCNLFLNALVLASCRGA